MRAGALLVCALLAPLSLVHLPAETARMPLDEVEAGMQGVGVTVFQGAEREEFDVEILGVLQNGIGPKRSLIVSRLVGGPLANTGVIQGMSGSPVYINDRLIGAVSYSLGSFSKDAIAGITPIEEMVATDASAATEARRRPGAGFQLPVTANALATVVRSVFGGSEPFARQPRDIEAFGLPLPEASRIGTQLRPIATPLILSGFSPELNDLWSSASRMGGFVTAVGGTMSAEAQEAVAGQRLQPGDAVGASLISGDLTMAGTGTVTMVENDRVYAFGHPFYNLGPARFPMTRAHVTTLLPSLAISSKVAEIGEVLGTIDQDRPTGIYGTLGPGPALIPVQVTLTEADRSLDESFRFEVVDDPLFTPLLTYTSLLNTFISWTRSVGPRSYVVSATARIEGQPDLRIEDVYSGNTASTAASVDIANPLIALVGNPFEPVQIEAVDVKITSVEEPRTATLERVWLDVDRPKAGDQVPLRVLSRNYRGAELLKTIMIDLPAHATGRLQLQVSDGASLTQQERQAGFRDEAAETLPQLIRNLNDTRRNNRIYVRLFRARAGAIDRGEPMPALPGSVLAVLDGNRSSGGLGRLRNATLGEWEILTDHVVSGSRMLTVDVE